MLQPADSNGCPKAPPDPAQRLTPNGPSQSNLPRCQRPELRALAMQARVRGAATTSIGSVFWGLRELGSSCPLLTTFSYASQRTQSSEIMVYAISAEGPHYGSARFNTANSAPGPVRAEGCRA
ncbi:hypothetical protein P7K49_017712 [Saguinus oedipus]|uniref:Uncharacterized protein n=1 Tax=Saguinus oedipus TaxID=9490 RepID=A0ABQ9V3A4_SAGOE|nr:hypothetical protein P7K49_017712 [Saguinus oedipus]